MSMYECTPHPKIMQSCFLLLGKPQGSSTPTLQQMKHHEKTIFLIMLSPLSGKYCTTGYGCIN